MNTSFIVFYGVFFLLLGSAQYYLSLRLWPLFSAWLHCPLWLYGILTLLTGLSYPLGRLLQSHLPAPWSTTLTVFGSYWLGVIFYGFLLFLSLDILFTLAKWSQLLSPAWQRQDPRLAAWGFLLLLIIFGYGVWNARHPIITHYDVSVDKQCGLQELNIVMVSDIHAGRMIGNGRLSSLVERINALKPDLILLPGDIIDEDVDVFAEENMAEQFAKLKSRFGVYATLGNHEYISRDPGSAANYLRQGGVNVLIDQTIKIADSIYVVGRDDLSVSRFTGKNRLELDSLLSGIDFSSPVLLMDHQPFHLEIPDQANVDLQVSGHTHQGQMFPLNFITSKLYEIDWGYLRKNHLQTIVSCGYGTWGPPLRIGNHPEIVTIKVHFTGAATPL
ncbi:MAG TPA: metallophosphoesterase [Patescibacteria group bacterium]|nr:metallophosphoesterase [Patescibacteria group bacterium]